MNGSPARIHLKNSGELLFTHARVLGDTQNYLLIAVIKGTDWLNSETSGQTWLLSLNRQNTSHCRHLSSVEVI